MKRLLLIFHVFMLSYLVILTIIKLTTIKTHRMQNMEEKAMKMNSPEIKHFIKKYDKGLIIFLFGIIIDQVIFLIVKKELAFIWVWGVLALTIVLVCIIGWQFAVRHYQGVEYVKGMGCKDEKLSEFSEEIAVARDEINKWNNKLDHLVAQRTSSITSLLDNVGQGLLYFSSDLIVKPEYSSVCREIFKGEISGRKISELIYPKDANNRRILEDALAIIINEKDSDRREVLFSLLPNEVEIKDNLIKIEYRDMEAPRYGTKSMMMILTDIKFNKLMENRMEQERNILKMVVNIVVNYDEFTECREDYRNFCLFGVNEIIEKGASREVEYSEIFLSLV
jgi:hypothetical protein